MDLIAENGGEIVITKRGKPVGKLVPFEQQPIPDLRGSVLYEAEDCWDPRPEWWFQADNPKGQPRA
jgi:antitoxin (DNA-binding transcriptional repressor) of toxin-antitoxin stability system